MVKFPCIKFPSFLNKSLVFYFVKPRPFLIHNKNLFKFLKSLKDRKKCDETNMIYKQQSAVEFYNNKLDRQSEACDQKEKLILTLFIIEISLV